MVGKREDESDDARQGHRDRDYGETEDEVGVPVLCQNSAVIRKKENRPEAADYGRSNPRNQRRLDFLRSTGRLEMVSVFMGSDSATKMEISANRVW